VIRGQLLEISYPSLFHLEHPELIQTKFSML